MNIRTYSSRLKALRKEINYEEEPNIGPILSWLGKRRKAVRAKIKLVKISELGDWLFDEKLGIIRHKKGVGKFFSIQGITVTNAKGSEVRNWNQPIFVQKEGGMLIILCQKKKNQLKFLLHAKFEAGNVNHIQLAPTIQATFSNLKKHHGGAKPRFSEYLNYPDSQVIYSAKHNEEGGRFYRKSNSNIITLLSEKTNLKLLKSDDYIWLTLPEIKKLYLYDNIVNPFVKTILSPL